jgi:hypothetical protein
MDNNYDPRPDNLRIVVADAIDYLRQLDRAIVDENTALAQNLVEALQEVLPGIAAEVGL